MSDDKKKQVTDWLQHQIKEADAGLAAFAKHLAEDPCEAFRWGDSARSCAAQRRVFMKVHDTLTGEGSKATLESVRDYSLDLVLRGASRLRRSTSPCANLIDQKKTVAWSTVHETVRSVLR